MNRLHCFGRRIAATVAYLPRNHPPSLKLDTRHCGQPSEHDKVSPQWIRAAAIHSTHPIHSLFLCVQSDGIYRIRRRLIESAFPLYSACARCRFICSARGNQAPGKYVSTLPPECSDLYLLPTLRRAECRARSTKTAAATIVPSHCRRNFKPVWRGDE